MQNLEKLLSALEAKIPYYETINTNVSGASVGWHIDHSLLTLQVIIGAMEKSAPENYKWKFNVKRTIVFAIQKFPRGRAKSPEVVVPKIECNADILHKHLLNIKEKVKKLSGLNPNQYFEHPIFGQLNVKPTIKFLGIHTNHHLKIINDIISKS